MNIERILWAARNKIAHRFPRYIDLNEAVDACRMEIADMASQKVAAAMQEAILGAQSKLYTEAAEYIEALYISEAGRIEIREDKKHLEYGYGPRQMLPDLLNSPKVKHNHRGEKTITVPVGISDGQKDLATSIQGKASELFSASRRLGATGKSLDQMTQSMREIIHRADSAPASIGGGAQEFATASETQDPVTQWVHPGFDGVKQLDAINTALKVDMEESAAIILESVANTMRH
jgi:hypothetical protein